LIRRIRAAKKATTVYSNHKINETKQRFNHSFSRRATDEGSFVLRAWVVWFQRTRNIKI